MNSDYNSLFSLKIKEITSESTRLKLDIKKFLIDIFYQSGMPGFSNLLANLFSFIVLMPLIEPKVSRHNRRFLILLS